MSTVLEPWIFSTCFAIILSPLFEFIAIFYRRFPRLSPHLSPFFKNIADLSQFYRRLSDLSPISEFRRR